MTTKEIRQKYLEFFQRKDHQIISSASLIPENDPSLLFVNSGMSPLIPYLSGENHPAGNRLVNSQKCFRSEDIDDVGDGRHNTFFEMLGNWSLNDYSKKEQLNWWFEFLIEHLGLDINKIYQTVYIGDGVKIQKDSESLSILKDIYSKYGKDTEEGLAVSGSGPESEIDFSRYKIFSYREDNWWQRGDAIGELGGPDSETFYDTGKEHDPKFGEHCHINCDCGRFIEIGNSVFMEYINTNVGWEKLGKKNVDFGGGLERLLMAVNNYNDIFEIDSLKISINKISEFSKFEYPEKKKHFEIIADHFKSAIFLMGDDKGLSPSNVDQGYIIRRLIRRSLRSARLLEIKNDDWIVDLVKTIISFYKEDYEELFRNQEFVLKNLLSEKEKFGKMIEKGERIINSLADSHGEMSGKMAFDLFQTHGYPLEMTEEIMEEKGIRKAYNFEKEYSECFCRHQELSKTSSEGKFKGGLADQGELTTKLHTASHLLLASLRKVLGDHVEQRGSNITAERLRFDFSHPKKMTEEEKAEVEKLVNEAISKAHNVNCEEMSIKKAREKGALGVFDDKYGEKVKIYSIGDFSCEICGGPHVKNISDLGIFKIKKEESSSAGVRRIKAVLLALDNNNK
jgi:alanyl-tRNA synthetase